MKVYSPYPDSKVSNGRVQTIKSWKVEHEVMEARLSGSDSLTYIEKTVSGNAHKCVECGLVWAKRWHAETCASRNHETAFVQRYAYKPEGYATNGKVAWNSYTRYALGRDKAEAREEAS
jgi:hypothetical protein